MVLPGRAQSPGNGSSSFAEPVRPTCRAPAGPLVRSPARPLVRTPGLRCPPGRPPALTARSGWPRSRWDTARMTPARQPRPQPLCPRSGRASSPAATHRNRFPTSSGRVSAAMAAAAPLLPAAHAEEPTAGEAARERQRPCTLGAPEPRRPRPHARPTGKLTGMCARPRGRPVPLRRGARRRPRRVSFRGRGSGGRRVRQVVPPTGCAAAPRGGRRGTAAGDSARLPRAVAEPPPGGPHVRRDSRADS